MNRKQEAYAALLKGQYEYDCDAWDVILETEDPVAISRADKRQALYKKVGVGNKMVGDFELDYAFEQLMRDNDIYFRQLGTALQKRRAQRNVYNYKKRLNEQFTRIFISKERE